VHLGQHSYLYMILGMCGLMFFTVGTATFIPSFMMRSSPRDAHPGEPYVGCDRSAVGRDRDLHRRMVADD